MKYTFDFGNIPIKLKKDRESWLKHDPDTTSPNQITFEMIRPFLSLRTSKKAKKDLGWKPKTSFKELIELMVNSDLKLSCKPSLCFS